MNDDDDDFAGQLWRSFLFLAACELHLQANEDLRRAEKMDLRFPPWAHFLRKRAAKKIARARRMAPGAYDGNYP